LAKGKEKGSKNVPDDPMITIRQPYAFEDIPPMYPNHVFDVGVRESTLAGIGQQEFMYSQNGQRHEAK
jgi:hypothetical protein